MDAQLQKLIEKIKEDGLKTSREESEKVLAEARKKADQIISDAKKESQKIKAEAEQEAALSEARGREALKQAGRDLLLSLKEEVRHYFDRFLVESSVKSLSDKDTVTQAVKAVLDKWSPGDLGDLALLLPEKQAKELEAMLKTRLAAEIKKGLDIKPASTLESGFRITEKDGSAFYDFSGEAMAEALATYMNPQLAELLKTSAKES